MESKKIRWGILGTGRIAKVLATALQVVDNSVIYSVGSRTKLKANEFASEFNIPNAYGSYEELVSDPNVDVIYIATPHNLHLENALLAMNNGKHVLCEKPLGVNRREVEMLIAKAKEKKVFLMEALWSRFLPRIIKTKELIDSGWIGEIKLMTAAFCFKSSHGPQQRHFNIDLCGGSVLDIGIYNIFLSLLLFGKPEKISSIAGLSKQGVDNSASYTFKYQTDMLSVMHSSFFVDSPVVAEIHGSKGKLILENRWFNLGNIKLFYPDGTEETINFDVKSNGYEYEAQEVINCILAKKNQSDLWSWDDSLLLVETMDSIRKECGIIYPVHDI